MAVNDLAGVSTYGPLNPEILLAGDKPYKTANATATGAKTKYQLAARVAGAVVDFVVGTHTAAQAVVVMQPCAGGAPCQYLYEGVVNDALLAAANVTLFTDAALDTFAERQAFLNGLLRVGKVGSGNQAV
jgi:hypothetical protein